MNFTEYLACDATRAGRARRRGARSAPRTAGRSRWRASTSVHAPRINAVCRLMEAEARAQLPAPPPAGPFAGVPFLLKDGVQDVAGLPTGYGSAGMRHVVPTQDAHIVRRYHDAGLVVFGKTNLPEFALKGVTDSRANGRTNNPWNLAHMPGGSSGGAAAAIAAGVVPMAAAADGGGSIRIPAACCGLFGLRPSRGRVSRGPGIGEAWFGASSEGVISRSVRDTARALDAHRRARAGRPVRDRRAARAWVEAMPRARPAAHRLHDRVAAGHAGACRGRGRRRRRGHGCWPRWATTWRRPRPPSTARCWRATTCTSTSRQVPAAMAARMRPARGAASSSR